jgi:hypothetical protein
MTANVTQRKYLGENESVALIFSPPCNFLLASFFLSKGLEINQSNRKRLICRQEHRLTATFREKTEKSETKGSLHTSFFVCLTKENEIEEGKGRSKHIGAYAFN